jgi:hypothetical protein
MQTLSINKNYQLLKLKNIKIWVEIFSSNRKNHFYTTRIIKIILYYGV